MRPRVWTLEPLRALYQGTVVVGPNNERITFWSEDYLAPVLSPREYARYEERRAELDTEFRIGARPERVDYSVAEHTKSGLYENKADYEHAVTFCAFQNLRRGRDR